MRIHTNLISSTDEIRAALRNEKIKGRIASTVYFRTLSAHRSRTHSYAYEVQLSSTDRIEGDGRRRGNDGAYDAMTDEYAATYDEWGWLLASLYRLDAKMVCPYYTGFEDYAHQTAYTYFPEQLIRMIDAHGDPYPYVRKGAARRGREGSVRVDGDTYPQGQRIERYYLDNFYRAEPRTAEWVVEFAHVVAEHV